MKILHISHDSLPDWRVEKSGITGIRQGHDVSFAGAKISEKYVGNTFTKIYEINWTSKARYGIPLYWRSVKKTYEKVIRDARPDIIHAHNIFSAKMVSELGIPFVYDDHEYWSKTSRLLDEIQEQNKINNLADKVRSFKRKFINKKIIKVWSKWEKELVSSFPTITVSQAIADELSMIDNMGQNTIFVVPNFPLHSEVENIVIPMRHAELSSVYAGGDGNNKVKFPQRNLDGFIESFNTNEIGRLSIIGWKDESATSTKVSYCGFLSRNQMFQELSQHSIGLLPWKKHWFHQYISPNKAYEYAHSGLFVMCVSSLKPITEYLLDHCLTFEDHNEMISQLKYFKENLDELNDKRMKIFEFARSNLVWENYEKNILRAYQKC